MPTPKRNESSAEKKNRSRHALKPHEVVRITRAASRMGRVTPQSIRSLALKHKCAPGVVEKILRERGHEIDGQTSPSAEIGLSPRPDVPSTDGAVYPVKEPAVSAEPAQARELDAKEVAGAGNERSTTLKARVAVDDNRNAGAQALGAPGGTGVAAHEEKGKAPGVRAMRLAEVRSALKASEKEAERATRRADGRESELEKVRTKLAIVSGELYTLKSDTAIDGNHRAAAEAWKERAEAATEHADRLDERLAKVLSENRVLRERVEGTADPAAAENLVDELRSTKDKLAEASEKLTVALQNLAARDEEIAGLRAKLKAASSGKDPKHPKKPAGPSVPGMEVF